MHNRTPQDQLRSFAQPDGSAGGPNTALLRTRPSILKCLAILFVASCLMEGWEPWDRMLFNEDTEVTLHFWVLLNCLNACLLNLSNFITASFVSPLTLQLLGNVKTVLGIFISALIFGNAVTPTQAVGCGAAVGGVYVYQRFGKSYESATQHYLEAKEFAYVRMASAAVHHLHMSTSPAKSGGVAFPSQYDSSGLSSWDKIESELRGAPLTLRCRMASDHVTEVQVSMGQDVAHAKALLAKLLDIPYSHLTLYYKGKLMFDPLSFNDFPHSDASAGMDIDVKIATE
ncbi:hypothetical protein FOZ63_032145 [Perkinsus olseni]|uniref:Ubiquitin-like domain-containing protein n=1 Tax=Perkinsus olseni TaxID=32597 RepID=A0A7J6PJ87_PEROL|nr:hypothetical protein FOZ63_032145 [Perkinsus olseni]